MLTIFRDRTRGVERAAAPAPDDLSKAIWIDLLEASEAEKEQVAKATGLYISSEAELSEIESSSRFFEEGGALYLSLPVIAPGPSGKLTTTPVGFALTQERLVTIRFARLPPFDQVCERLSHANGAGSSGAAVFIALLEGLIEPMADMLERTRADLDGVSARIFERHAPGRGTGRSGSDLRQELQVMGQAGDLISRVRDSLLALGRVIPYVARSTAEWLPKDLRPRLKTARQDIASLNDYDAHLTVKVQFLLDAILGFINITQSNIIKVMTVVGVVGVPPTLIASIYGMNFEVMPELRWAWGYPAALVLIVLSAILPLLWFRRRGWL
jgi:magnesium transporter